MIVELAKNISSKLKEGDVILLSGPMGSGKTFFVRHLLSNYGFKDVSSPTYTLVNEYRVEGFNFVHIDAQRINNIDYIEHYFDKKNIILIEWFENINELIPYRDYEIRIDYSGEEREVSINVLSSN